VYEFSWEFQLQLLRRISAGERHSVRQRRLVLMTTGGAGRVRWSYLLHVQNNSNIVGRFGWSRSIVSVKSEKRLNYEHRTYRAGPLLAVVTTARGLWLTVERLRPSHESCTTVARSRGSRATVSTQSRPLQ